MVSLRAESMDVQLSHHARDPEEGRDHGFVRRRRCRAIGESPEGRATLWPVAAVRRPKTAPPSDDGATQAGGHAAQVDRAPFGEVHPHEQGAYQPSRRLPRARPASGIALAAGRVAGARRSGNPSRPGRDSAGGADRDVLRVGGDGQPLAAAAGPRARRAGTAAPAAARRRRCPWRSCSAPARASGRFGSPSASRSLKRSAHLAVLGDGDVGGAA